MIILRKGMHVTLDNGEVGVIERVRAPRERRWEPTSVEIRMDDDTLLVFTA